jgi:hypothetical protein
VSAVLDQDPDRLERLARTATRLADGDLASFVRGTQAMLDAHQRLVDHDREDLSVLLAELESRRG